MNCSVGGGVICRITCRAFDRLWDRVLTHNTLEYFTSIRQPSPARHLLILLFDMIELKLLLASNRRVGETEDVDLGAGELPRGDLVLEEEVEFRKGSTSRFGDSKVGVDDRETTSAGPNESRVIS